MGLFDAAKKRISQWLDSGEKKQEPVAYTRPGMDHGGSSTFWSYNDFNGEKSLGGIGPATVYSIDEKTLRVRGWEAYLTNETVQTIINKMVSWVIGRGLRLQAEPNVAVLESEGITITKEMAQALSDLVESRFSQFKEQRWSTYTREYNLSQLEAINFRNTKIGGDTLVVIYFDGEFPVVHLIDGCHVKSPQGGNDFGPNVLANGNRIVNGVEMNDRGIHIAYHVQQADLSFKRIQAWSKTTGLRLAYLVGGLQYRLDYTRCMSAISGILEVLATMDRYKSATLETAEETSKQAFQMVFGPTSTGENPLVTAINKARDAKGNDGTIPVDQQRREVANTVAASTKKQVWQMPIDSKLEPIEKSKGELYFKDFYSTFFDMVCAAVNMPPNVAMSKYDSNFSAARAAIKDWEHTLVVERYNYAQQFLQPIYEFYLYVETRRNKIQLPGYLNAYNDGNRMIIAAYHNARWMGDNVPHIDPLKEVEAVRRMLGDTGGSLPLIDHESAVEKLGGGNAKSIRQQYAKEKDEAESLGIKAVEKQPGSPPNDSENEEGNDA